MHGGELVEDALQALRQRLGELRIGCLGHGLDHSHEITRHRLARLGRGGLVEPAFSNVP